MPTLTIMLVVVTSTQGVTSPEEWVRKELARPVPLFEIERVRFELTLVMPPSRKRAKDDIARDGSLPEFPGKSVRQHTLWAVGPGRWRIGTDFPGMPEGFRQYHDSCEDGAESWMASPGQLTATRTEWGFPGGMDARHMLDEFESWATLVLSGSLNATRRSSDAAESVAHDGGARYHAIVRSSLPQGEIRHRVEFEWDESRGRGFVRRREVISSFMPVFVGYSIRFGAWKPAGVGDLWLTERVEYETSQPKQTWIVLPGVLKQEPAETMAAVLRPPTPGETDAVRGEVRTEGFADYRTRKPVFIRNSTGPESLPQLPGMDATARRLAWAAGALGVFLVGLVYVRRRASSPSKA